MICVPIMEATGEEALRAIERYAPTADAVELRLDMMAGADLGQLIEGARRASSRIKIIVTCRRPEESLVPATGGAGAGGTEITPKARMDLLREAVRLKADFVDIELATGEEAIGRLQTFCRRKKSPTRLIVSWHDISRTPSLARLKEIFQACVHTGADVVKIVPYARTMSDNLKVLRLIDYARKEDRPIIAMCMGEEGKFSRIMAPFRGSLLSFASAPGGRSSAPGQLTVNVMREFAHLLGNPGRPAQHCFSPGDASNFILLGNPVRQSLSPLMHNKALEAMQVDGHYSAFCVSGLAAAVDGIRGMNIRGASVTLPFKEMVIEYLDEIDADAAALGAVNTIVNNRGRLTGYNTDWLGLVQALKSKTTLAGKTFVVLGAGGTARAAVYGLKKEGGRAIIVNRTREKGRALAALFDCAFYPVADLGKIKAHGLVNTTPVGMYPKIQQSPVAQSILAHYQVVMDVIYNPLQTKLLQDAEANGCKIVYGLEMFVQQGAGQLKLWTGRQAPLELMRKIVRERLENREC